MHEEGVTVLVYRHAWRQRATERPLSAKGLVRADMRGQAGHGRWLPFWSCSQQALRRGQSRILPKRAPRVRRDRAFHPAVRLRNSCQVVECILTPPVPQGSPSSASARRNEAASRPGGPRSLARPSHCSVACGCYRAVSQWEELYAEPTAWRRLRCATIA